MSDETISTLEVSSQHQQSSTVSSLTTEPRRSRVSARNIRALTSSSLNGSSQVQLDYSGSKLTPSNPEFPSLVRVSNRRRRMSTALNNGLTMHRLQFPSGLLYGRQQDVDVYQDVINNIIKGEDEIADNQSSSEENTGDNLHRRKAVFALLSGESGVGKSVLAKELAECTRKSLAKQAPSSKRVVLIRGLFVENQKQPYSGIGKAVGELCGHILSLTTTKGDTDEEEYNKIRQRILSEFLDEDLQAIAQVMPILQEIMNDSKVVDSSKVVEVPDSSSNSTSTADSISEDRKNRFHHLFRKFLRIVLGSPSFPNLIMILDDLHWADQASVDLLTSLFMDTSIGNLYVIATTRPEGVLESPEDEGRQTGVPSVKTIEVLKAEFMRYRYTYMHRKIENLSLPDLNEMLQDLLRSDGEEVLAMAELCHRKTDGNAFFVKQFLTLLTERRLLDFNLGALKWVWDETEIEASTQATANVVEMMKDSMDELPRDVSALLQLAACLGPSFMISLLRLVWEKYQGSNNEGEEGRDRSPSMDDTLEVAIDRGFLIRPNESSHRLLIGDDVELFWVHSKVLESTIDYIPEEDQRKLRVAVGEILLHHLGKTALNESIFVVVDLLNSGIDHARAQPSTQLAHDGLHMARLNLQAVEKSVSIAAFESATSYASSGISFLEGQNELWADETSRRVALRLYSISAEAEAVLGHPIVARARCDEVIRQTQVSIADKAPVYYALANLLYTENRIENAKAMCLDFLSKVGCHFPKSKISKLMSAAYGLYRIKRAAKEISLDEVEKLPSLDDQRRFRVFRVLDKLLILCYYTKDPLMLPVLLRQYDWTTIHGVSIFAPQTLASIGLVAAAFLTDFATARVFAEFSLSMLQRFDNIGLACQVYNVAYGGALHFSQPIHTTLKPLQQGYELGMSGGDFVRAFHGLLFYLQASLVSGRSLVLLQSESRLYEEQTLDFHIDVVLEPLRSIMRLISALRDTSKAGTEHDIMPTEGLNAVNQAYRDTFKLQLAVWFGDFETAVKVADTKLPVAKGVPGCTLVYSDTLMRGIAYFEMAQQHKKRKGGRSSARKYRVKGQQMLKTFKKFIDRGNPNVQHHEALLDAELARLQGKKTHIVRKHYDVAVVMARRRGFIHDAALANERYGEFLLNEIGDQEEAVYRLKEAVKLHEEWGAHAKASSILEKHKTIWEIPKAIFAA